ncbi:glycosyltransferase family 39 protein [Patescibacteria group bacterium]
MLVEKFAKPYIVLLFFLNFMVLTISPSNSGYLISLIGSFLFLLVVFLMSERLKESDLTTLLSLLVSLVVLITVFVHFKVNPDSYPNDQSTYNTMGKIISKYFEYGKFPKPTPEPIKIFNIIIGERSIEPSAYRPVGYPLFIALIYLITGTNSYIFVLISQYLLHLISILLFFNISKRVVGEKLSSLAVILYTLNAPLIFVSNSFLSESLAQFLLLVIIYSTLMSLKKEERSFPILGGICGGLLVLVRPIYIVYIPLLFILAGYESVRNKKLNKKITTIAITSFLVCTSWIVRNSLLAGQFTSIATNGGINMLLGNNDSIQSGRAIISPDAKIEEIIGDKNLMKERRVSIESSLDKALRKGAIEWILEHPVLFMRLAIDKVQHLLIPHRGLFDNLEHFNNPRIDKFYLLLSYQGVYFWLLLFLVSTSVFSKKGLPILITSIPYVGMVFLSFATTRFQLPLYIPASLLGALGIENLKNIKKTNKAVLVTGLALLLIHFSRWKETLFEPFRDYKYRSSIVSAAAQTTDSDTLVLVETSQGKGESKYIIKIFDESIYIKANLEYMRLTLDAEGLKELLKSKRVITFDLDILDYLETEFVNNFALIYSGKKGELPYFEIAYKKNLNALNAKLLSANVFSDLKDKPKLVFNSALDANTRYLFLNITLTKGSSITVVGKEEIKLKIRPRMKKTMDLDVLIPQESLGLGAKIFIENNSVVNDPDNMSMYRDNRYMWGPTQVRINQLSIIY